MNSKAYLAFGIVVLATYWFTASRGYVFFQQDEPPTPNRVIGPTFWGAGYQGGK